MKCVIVRYRTKPDRADENQRLVESVFEELAATDPGGLRYATFRLEDDESFVHIAAIESEDGSSPLRETAAFAEFQRQIGDRCSEPPDPVGATLVGSYRLLDG